MTKFWALINAHPASPVRARLIGIGLMCLCAWAWAIIERVPSVPIEYLPYQLVWMRYGIHLLFMLTLLGRPQRAAIARTPRLKLQVVRSLLMFGMPVAFILAVKQGVDSNFVWAVTWVSVPITLATGAWRSGERVGAGLWAAAIVGLAGTWLLLGSPLPRGVADVWLPLVVAACYGIYVALTRELRTEPTSTNLFHTALWVFLVLSMVVPFVWQPLSWTVIGAAVFVGLWGFVMLVLLDRAVAMAPVAIVAPFIYTESIWGMFSLWWRYGYLPTAPELLGAAIILLSCAGILVYVLMAPAAGRPVLARTADSQRAPVE